MDCNVRIGLFFEGIDALLHRPLIDIELVDDLFIGPVRIPWNKLKPTVEGYGRRNSPQAYEWFECLHSEMQRREQGPQQIQQ